MATPTNDQRFVVILIIGLFSGSWLSLGTTAQTFTTEDRDSILKFMDVLINFLDATSDNATSTENPNNNNATTPANVESTTLVGITTTESSISESTTASNGTESTTDGIISNESTEAASNVTTVPTVSSTTAASTSTAISPITPTRRRICFKRVCYKFVNDKGYIV